VCKWLYSMGFPHESTKPQAGEDSVLTDEECKSLLDEVRTSSDSDLLGFGFEPLTVGFANHVWATKRRGQALVLKRYTDAAFLRVDAGVIGSVDVHCGNHGIGPRVLYSSPQGMVMERIEGNTLVEADMHSEDLDLLENVAELLAELHQLPLPEACKGQQPMMWKSIGAMLEASARKPELWPEGMPSIDAVAEEVSKAQLAIEQRNCCTVLCHGDFKPSNVVQSKSGKISFIDHELGGLNYRSFDLMKVFRTAEKSSQASMEHFICTYAEKIGLKSEAEIAELMREAKVFESLTWLEAACFFLAMPQFKPSETTQWNELALDRWQKYESTRDALLGKAAWQDCMAWLG